ncbi:Hypothetical protein, putative [Bodo saltans]|uniref:PLA2c domain-containing protein n=1 Tax=Bodo saltans TaxID=75058 RepID=A0A0S4IUS0_BODSA|nr:Hypothetical protein, putative [Bodo saltans]|eukprot:CUF95622.1 Hypothetical protein, putative [Bodo saltans]
MGSDHSKEFSYRRAAGANPPPLSPQEIAAIKKRRPKSRKALLKFIEAAHPELHEELQKYVATHPMGDDISGPADALPRIGIAVSGGGWRAMTAGVAVMDELSRVGLLDTVEVASGLSGGSWFIQNWALGGVGKNAFHEPPLNRANNTEAPAPSTVVHPWAYGERFVPRVHRYEGLIHMLSKKVVHNSAQIPHLLQPLGKFADFLTNADTTFFRLLVLSKGGKSMISRYASFLDRLLTWHPNRETLLLENAVAAAGPSDGVFPVFVVAAVDTITHDPVVASQTPPAQLGKSKNVWTEFSPYGARSRNIEFGETQSIAQLHVEWDKKKSPLTAGRLMAVCGSAFAVDAEQVATEKPWLKQIASFLGGGQDEGDVILTKAMTKTYVSLPKQQKSDHTPTAQQEVEKVLFGQLRDAGLDFNVPFPLMLKQSSGRVLDIVIAIDAGYASTGAGTLAAAVKYGYVEIEGSHEESFGKPFQPVGDRVRVFFPPVDHVTGERKGPIIVYVVVLNSTVTSKIVFTREEVIACTSLVRQTIRDQAVAEIFRCIQNYSLDHLAKTGAIPPARREELGNFTASFDTTEVAVKPSGAVDTFQEATHAALDSLQRENPTEVLNGNPLVVMQRVERVLVASIDQPLRVACVQRITELTAVADYNGTVLLKLSNPLDATDAALLKSGWIKEIARNHSVASIDQPLRVACVQRITELTAVADHNGTVLLKLSNPLDATDAALLKSGWIKEIARNHSEDGEVAFVLADDMLFDYSLATTALLELAGFVASTRKAAGAGVTPEALSKVLKRDSALVLPLPEHIPRAYSVLRRMSPADPSWRFVYTYLAMLVNTPVANSLELDSRFTTSLADSVAQIFANHETQGKVLTPITSLTQAQYLRYDVREQVRRQLGISIMVEAFCFITRGDESCVANEQLMKLWKPYFDGDGSGRFAYFVLDSVLSCARGVRCLGLVSALLPQAKAFVKSTTSGDRHLLAVALYCSSFRNGGNIELLKSSNIKGDSAAENPAQHCTLLDACTVGNHNAVEMILEANINGVPPIAAVQRSIENNFPKCVDALIHDEEVDRPFLESVRKLLQGK